MTGPENLKNKREQDDWAGSFEKEALFLRENGLRVGLDPFRLVRGYALSTITGDDQNIFVWLSRERFKKKLALNSALQLKIRLNAEIVTEELPEDIRTGLTEVKEQIGLLDMGKFGDFFKGFGIWEDQRRLIEKQIKSLPELSADVDYWINSLDKLPPKAQK